MKCCLVRILGNDLPPRHDDAQTITNLDFILRNEPSVCDKVFLLNRVWHPGKLRALIERLKHENYGVVNIPFVLDEYRSLNNDKDRLLYLTHQNEARNLAIKLFADKYDIVMPFDGGTCFTKPGWMEFVVGVEREELQPYYIVDMWRLRSYFEYFHGLPTPNELTNTWNGQCYTIGEPQVCFTRLSDRHFTRGMEYGMHNKVEMLWKLGIQGPWGDTHVDLMRSTVMNKASKYYGQVKTIGFVCRLPATCKEDTSKSKRIAMREQAKIQVLQDVDSYYR